jgi:pyruvate ferredoxin oxidoreductase gamma subunit
MLRLRFHGRGGHGVKTSSRIVGTAAFLGGLYAQDSPVYGAERRGAALAAFTRIDRAPISERGQIAKPDLLLVADETLLDDPVAGVLLGCENASAVFVNSPRPDSELVSRYSLRGAVITRDATALCARVLGRGSALSAAVGAVGCRLAGLADDLAEQAIREELADLPLSPAIIERNIEAARLIRADVEPIRVAEKPPSRESAVMHEPTWTGVPRGAPVIANPGNSIWRHTGAWRIARPVIDLEACTQCGLCSALCPDGVIHRNAEGRPAIDLDNCKGCMICREVCPIHCILEEKEVRAW